MGIIQKAAFAAAVATVPMVGAAHAQEAQTSPITTTQDDDTGIRADAIVRVHAATLADGDIKFTELPELGLNIDFTDSFRLVLNGNVISPPGENMGTIGLDNSRFLVGDAFARFKLNDGNTYINLGQFEWAYGQDFGEAWVQSGVGPAAPQILDEPSFAAHGIPQLRGIQVEHTAALSDNNSVYMTGVVGQNAYSDDVQGMALARYTHTGEDGGTLSLTGQYFSRAAGDGTEQGLFGILQVRHPVNDSVGLRGDVEVGAISNVGGASGQDGTYFAARGFADFTHSDRFSTYLGIGAFHEAAGDSYQAIEGGAAYKLTDNLTAHAGLGYANGGFAQGLSTTAGLTYTLQFK